MNLQNWLSASCVLADSSFFFYYLSKHELSKLLPHWAPTFPWKSHKCCLLRTLGLQILVRACCTLYTDYWTCCWLFPALETDDSSEAVVEEGEGLCALSVLRQNWLRTQPLVKLEGGGSSIEIKREVVGCDFGSSNDQLFHLVYSLKEGGSVNGLNH